MKNLISKAQFTSFKKSVITTAARWNDALHYCLFHAQENQNTQPLNELLNLAPCRTALGNLTAQGRTAQAYVIACALPCLSWQADRKRFQYKAHELTVDLDTLPPFTDHETAKDNAKAEREKEKALKNASETALKREAREAREALILAEKEKEKATKKADEAAKVAAISGDLLDQIKAKELAEIQAEQEKEARIKAEDAEKTKQAAIAGKVERLKQLGALPIAQSFAALERLVHGGIDSQASKQELIDLAALVHSAQVLIADKIVGFGMVEALTVDSTAVLQNAAIPPSGKAKRANKKQA